MVYFLLPCLLWPAEKALQRKQDECANATNADNYGKAIPKLHPAEAERQGCWNETDVCVYIYTCIHTYIHTCFPCRWASIGLPGTVVKFV